MGSTLTAGPDLQDQIRRHLSERSIRYTSGRQAVIKALQRAGGPRSAAELHTRLRRLPLSSLYRSLAVLDEAGVLRKHHDADGLARFELAEWLSGHHHHLVCLDCGLVEDVELDAGAESTLHEIAAGAAAVADYSSTGHVLEIEGLCRTCRP
jgi:Fe2+ or Zn2+ uptake regulation protein